MTDIPIIFSGPMIRALLDGRKTMTRRLAWRSEVDTKKMEFICDGEKPNPLARKAKGFGVQMAGEWWLRPTPWVLAKPGDRLWVRESLKNSQAGWAYAVDNRVIEMSPKDPRVSAMIAWAHHKEQDHATSIHMPRWASRLTLIVSATKIERLQNISEDDAVAESCHRTGWTPETDKLASVMFRELWESLHGGGSWAANPEVVALSFHVHKQNIDAMPKAEAA